MCNVQVTWAGVICFGILTPARAYLPVPLGQSEVTAAIFSPHMVTRIFLCLNAQTSDRSGNDRRVLSMYLILVLDINQKMDLLYVEQDFLHFLSIFLHTWWSLCYVANLQIFQKRTKNEENSTYLFKFT